MTYPPLVLDRRTLLTAAAVTAAGLLMPRELLAAELVPTPGQTEGPFYPVTFPPTFSEDRRQKSPIGCLVARGRIAILQPEVSTFV
jgi:hypothetical protein